MIRSMNQILFTTLTILLIALAVGAQYKMADFSSVHFIWISSLLLIAGMVALIGIAKTGHPFGIAIDARNRYSLSRAQMTFWTILVLGTVYTIIIWNTGHSPVPVAVADKADKAAKALPFLFVPSFLWALMGISSISLVGSPLILNNKPAGELPAANATGRDARLSDLVFGEETGNQGTVDLARVQMLLISIIVGVSYTVLIAARIGEDAKTGAIKGFPDMDGGLLALIAISHAGYLTYKVVKK